jgi:glucose-6-phosphate-specific signal transduction histidine kinase
MRERIEAIGGTLRITSDGGTRLIIELPEVDANQSRQATAQQSMHIVA